MPGLRGASLSSDPQPLALTSVSLHDLSELPAEHPEQAQERDQHHDAEARRGIVDGRLRELTEGIAGRDNCAGPKTRRDEVERKGRACLKVRRTVQRVRMRTLIRALGVRRTHKGIATTADHIWIARNRGKFIPITRVDSTQPVLFV